jgi:transposase
MASSGCCGRERPWRDLPDDFGPYTTCYNRFVRWRRAGVWGRIMDALAIAHDASVQMIDTSIVRVHQHGACIIRNRKQSMGRSRGGLTSKIPAVVDTNGLAVRLALTAGEAHDNPLADKLLSRLKQDQCCWQIGAMMPIRSEPLPPRKTSGPTSTAVQSKRADLLQPVSLPCSQLGRTLVQQDQALPPGCNALRQTRRELLCVRAHSRRSGYGCALMSPRPSQR